MMIRVSTALLHAALALSSIAAILFAVRIILQQALNIGRWYWAGAVAVSLAPLLIAAALTLLQRLARPEARADA